jgi:hypothetical protein
MFSHQASASMQSANVLDMPTFVFEIQDYPEDLGLFSSYQIAVISSRGKKP